MPAFVRTDKDEARWADAKKEAADEGKGNSYAYITAIYNRINNFRDQVRYPTAADGKVVLEECAAEGGPHFSLHYDVARAHRRIPVLRC